MEIADAFYSEYGEQVTGMQGKIQSQGNAYLKASWPNLDYIKTATIEGDTTTHGTTDGKQTDAKSEEGGNTLFYVFGGFAVAAALVWTLTKKPEEAPKKPSSPKSKGDSTPDAPRKKKKKRPQP